LGWGRIADNLTISWQNYAEVGLPLKFALEYGHMTMNLNDLKYDS